MKLNTAIRLYHKEMYVSFHEKMPFSISLWCTLHQSKPPVHYRPHFATFKVYLKIKHAIVSVSNFCINSSHNTLQQHYEHNVQIYLATTELRRFYHFCESPLEKHSGLPEPNSSYYIEGLICKTAPSMCTLLLVIQPFHWLWKHGTS